MHRPMGRAGCVAGGMAQPILNAMIICLCHLPEKFCSQKILEQSYAGPAWFNPVADETELRTQRIGLWAGLGVQPGAWLNPFWMP
jgi:hypothetical protein